MWKRAGLALISCSALFAGVASLWQPGPEADAAGQYRRILPALAADSVPGAANATPTPTTVPGGGSATDLWVTVIIWINALELSATGSGTVPVLIQADAEGKMPTAQQIVTTIPGNFSIADHPVDSIGCAWPRTDVSTSFAVHLYHTNGASVLMGMTSPEWHYFQQCPASVPPVRFPAFGEESLELFLRDVMAPYRSSQIDGVLLPLIPSSSPGCLQYYGAFSHSGIQADPAQVFVYVHQKPCQLPPLLPLPSPSPAPTPPPTPDPYVYP